LGNPHDAFQEAERHNFTMTPMGTFSTFTLNLGDPLNAANLDPETPNDILHHKTIYESS